MTWTFAERDITFGDAQDAKAFQKDRDWALLVKMAQRWVVPELTDEAARALTLPQLLDLEFQLTAHLVRMVAQATPKMAQRVIDEVASRALKRMPTAGKAS